MNWAHSLGPPGPSTSSILGTFSRFSEAFLAERARGGSLGDLFGSYGILPGVSLSAREVSENLEVSRSLVSTILYSTSYFLYSPVLPTFYDSCLYCLLFLSLLSTIILPIFYSYSLLSSPLLSH